jgi:hypothetical protein
MAYACPDTHSGCAGAGLRAARAGVPVNFYIKCYDVFGLARSSSAKFRIDIEGDVIAGGGLINPTPFAMPGELGLYKVVFTLLKVGKYSVRVKVRSPQLPHMYTCTCIHIYREREREREMWSSS